MNIIVIITIIVLIIMGLFHFYWVIGGKIGLDKALPTKDGKLLLNPGKILTTIVGIGLLGFGYIAYVLQFKDLTTMQYANYYVNISWMLSAIFIIRAIGEFNAIGFFKKIKETQFAIYDTKYFSPLCLVLGVIFSIRAFKCRIKTSKIANNQAVKSPSSFNLAVSLAKVWTII